MNAEQRLPMTTRVALVASAVLALGLTACAPEASEYEGEDRSGLTEEVDARSPVIPGPDDEAESDAPDLLRGG